MMRGRTLGILALLLGLATAEVHAHAMLDHAEPSSGAVVTTAPEQVTLSFTERLEPAFSTVAVTDAAGQRIDTGNMRVEGNQMSVSLRPAGEGTYHVKWQVISVDTHKTAGSFSFQVGR